MDDYKDFSAEDKALSERLFQAVSPEISAMIALSMIMPDRVRNYTLLRAIALFMTSLGASLGAHVDITKLSLEEAAAKYREDRERALAEFTAYFNDGTAKAEETIAKVFADKVA